MVIDLEKERERRQSGPVVFRELACHQCGHAWSGVADLCGLECTDEEINESFEASACPKCGTSPILVLWRDQPP